MHIRWEGLRLFPSALHKGFQVFMPEGYFKEQTHSNQERTKKNIKKQLTER